MPSGQCDERRASRTRTQAARSSAQTRLRPHRPSHRLPTPAVDVSSWAAMAGLQSYVDHRVLLILQDGRAIVGVMAGYDQKSNVVLSDSKERVYSMDEGVEEIPLGLYLVKGDQIVLIGELDEATDKAVDLSTIRAEPLPPIRY
ncbi:hypothetical protein BD413DRAFT_582258 [Trametes elegans]|nr:hypothetical protein BD413DRAFT_582258 [Trametes elegans]